MKLFIVAALVSVATAARLEHLERGYLPPNHSHGQAGFGSQGSQGFGSEASFGSGSNGHGSFGASPFDSNVIDSAGAGTRSQGLGSASFPGATSNQYLPPNHGPSGSNGQFSGSLSGFQHSQYTPQSSFGGASQYNTPNQYGSAGNGLAQSRYQQQQQYSNGGSSQFPATSRQYLAPKPSSYPQQAFDEQTGYHY